MLLKAQIDVIASCFYKDNHIFYAIKLHFAVNEYILSQAYERELILFP